MYNANIITQGKASQFVVVPGLPCLRDNASFETLAEEAPTNQVIRPVVRVRTCTYTSEQTTHQLSSSRRSARPRHAPTQITQEPRDEYSPVLTAYMTRTSSVESVLSAEQVVRSQRTRLAHKQFYHRRSVIISALPSSSFGVWAVLEAGRGMLRREPRNRP